MQRAGKVRRVLGKANMMLESVGKYVGAKVLSAILIVSSAGAGIWFWKHPEQLETIWSVLKSVLVWLGLVLVLPWASYPLTKKVVATDSNRAAIALIAGLFVADGLFALYLSGWSISGALARMVVVLGLLSAAVYNFIVCDFQAQRLEDSM